MMLLYYDVVSDDDMIGLRGGLLVLKAQVTPHHDGGAGCSQRVGYSMSTLQVEAVLSGASSQ